jgi:hypothetical protein
MKKHCVKKRERKREGEEIRDGTVEARRRAAPLLPLSFFSLHFRVFKRQLPVVRKQFAGTSGKNGFFRESW